MKLILIYFFLLCGAFFACAEMTLLSLSKFELKTLVHDPRYKKLLLWLKNPGRFIVGLLAGNNISNIGFSAIYSIYILKKFSFLKISPFISNIFSFITATYIILVFCEIIPKNLGRLNANLLIRYLYKPLIISLKILSPVVFIFDIFDKKFSKKNKIHDTKLTMADMHSFVDYIEEQGVIEEDSEDIIHSYLDLRTQKVRDIMVPLEKICSIDITTKNFIEKAYEIGRSRIPVFKGEIHNIVGLLYAKDLAAFVFDDKELDLSKILRNVVYVESNDKLKDVFKYFQKNRKHMAIVRENSEVVGLITMEDILEEIIGEIFDEYDVKRKKI